MAVDQFIEAADLDWEFASGVQRAIFLEMVYRADRTGTVRMSLSEISNVTRFSIATVKREATRLVDAGLLIHERHGRYTISVPVDTEHVALGQRVRAWVEQEYGRGFADDGRRIVVTMDHPPEFIDEAVEQGVMVLERDSIATPTGLAKQFSLHFHRRQHDADDII
jgi:hypothetical protein